MPSGGSAKIRYAPQLGQVGRLAWPIGKILPLVLTETREIAPYAWVHPDEERSTALQHEGGAFSSAANYRKQRLWNKSSICQLNALLKGWEPKVA